MPRNLHGCDGLRTGEPKVAPVLYVRRRRTGTAGQGLHRENDEIGPKG